MERVNEDEVTDLVCIAKAGERARLSGKPVFAMRHQRSGWKGALPLYVLWCEACREFTVTHPAGYGRITCQHCRRRTHRVMTWQRFRDKRLKAYLYALPRLLLIPMFLFMLWLLLRP